MLLFQTYSFCQVLVREPNAFAAYVLNLFSASPWVKARRAGPRPKRIRFSSTQPRTWALGAPGVRLHDLLDDRRMPATRRRNAH